MKAERNAYRIGRHEQPMTGFPKDSYATAAKPGGPAYCPECAASFQRGRWSWRLPAASARPVRCAACRRIAEKMPAGYVTLSGTFFAEHRDEVLRRVRRCEEAQKRLHPLQRLMAVRRRAGETVVTTTDVHLARRIGEALAKSFKGRLSLQYAKGEALARVRWTR